MSIENGVATGLSKVPGQASGGPGKAKAAAGPGGFAALLQDVGADVLSAKGKAAIADSGRTQQEPKVDDASQVPPGGDAASAAASMIQPNVEPTVSEAATEERTCAVRAASARVQSSRGEMQAGADAAQDAGHARPVLGAGDPDGQAAAELQPLLKQAALNQRMAQQRQQTDGATTAQAGARGQKRGEDVAARLGWQMTEHLNNPAANAPQIVLAGVAGESGLRSGERRHEKTERSVGTADAVAWNSSLPSDTPRLDVPAAAPDAGSMTEMRVAEQVSYWASRGGVQNAELQVDGLGEGPVKVSIALQGQEARVEFRADQAQTRQVLEDAMPHLRELLAREGLVLSGVSVGASGSDGAAGRQPQEGRKGARETTVAVPELQAVTQPATRGAALSGRSVDLFV